MIWHIYNRILKRPGEMASETGLENMFEKPNGKENGVEDID